MDSSSSSCDPWVVDVTNRTVYYYLSELRVVPLPLALAGRTLDAQVRLPPLAAAAPMPDCRRYQKNQQDLR